MKFKPGHFPGVYLAYKRGEVVYVGQSPANVYRRVIWTEHKRLQDCDLVRVFVLDSSSDARWLETQLIRILNPRLNGKRQRYAETRRTEAMKNATSAKEWLTA